MGVIHVDSIVHGAHLIPVYGEEFVHPHRHHGLHQTRVLYRASSKSNPCLYLQCSN
jgi:hypothetical protein